MQINELLARARDYIYDQDGLEDFLALLLPADEVAQREVARYLAGHGLMIGRWVDARGRKQDWVWLDKLYLPGLKDFMEKHEEGHFELVGLGRIERFEQFAQLPLG